jgi:hypothetical protein
MQLADHQDQFLRIANKHIAIHGLVRLGPAQSEIFMRHLPATKIEPDCEHPRLLRLTDAGGQEPC